jgi:hypothetical protein
LQSEHVPLLFFPGGSALKQQVQRQPGRRLDDEELLRTEFRYHDPENIPGLNFAVPDPGAHPTIIGYYDETPPGGRRANPDAPMIRCSHCGLRRHWKGYVVQDDRAQLYIIGAQKCGHDHYGGERFADAENTFRQDLERQRALRRWQKMMLLVPALKKEVDLLLSCEQLRRLELKRDEIKRASPEGFAALVRNHGSGKPMIEVREERDFAEEAKRAERYERALAAYQKLPPEERRRRRDEGLQPQPDDSPIIVRKTEELGPLMGAGFLTDAGDVRAAALDLRKSLHAVEALNRTTKSAWVTELNRLLKEMTDKPKRILEAHLELGFVKAFFRTDNLERIERWSRSYARFSYKADDGCLLVQDASRGRAHIEPPREVELPTTPVIDGMQYRTDDFAEMMADAA